MNPQSSRSSIALGPVPTALKPAPNPITTNMPQFGSASSLTNSAGVPTLPPVSPSTTQPLAPAPSPAPVPTPVSAMPQYMNSANTNMIPVVDKPLDVNKVPDTPAEQYNPFASMSNSSAPQPPKKSSSHTLDIILGLLTALFAIAAVIFFILWQQVEPRIVYNKDQSAAQTDPNTPSNPEQPSENPDQPAAQNRHISCRGAGELTEGDIANGMTGNSSVYNVYYPEANPTEIHIISTAEYNSPEAAAAVFAETANETFAYLTGIFASIGIDISTENFVLDGNTVSATFIIPAEKLTNPEADVFSRQMLATVVGFPSILSEDGTVLTIYTDIDSVRANYESAGLTCEIVE